MNPSLFDGRCPTLPKICIPTFQNVDRAIMTKVTFIERNGKPKVIDAKEGQSLLEIAWDNEVDIEGACEGSMACATCHVIVDAAWFSMLPAPSEDEKDMLDLAYDIQKTSRLGCQITMTDALDGLVVRLPRDVRKMLL